MATVSQYEFVRPDQIPENATVIEDGQIKGYWAQNIDDMIEAATNRLKNESDEKEIEQLSIEVVDLIRKSFSVTRTVLVKTEIEIHF